MLPPAKALFNEFCQKQRVEATFSVEQCGPLHQPSFRCVLTCRMLTSGSLSSCEKTFTAEKRSKKEAQHAAAELALNYLDSCNPVNQSGEEANSPVEKNIVPTPLAARKRKASELGEEDLLQSQVLEYLRSEHSTHHTAVEITKSIGLSPKDKKRVNHVLYEKLKTQGLAELIPGTPPQWRATTKDAKHTGAAASGGLETVHHGGSYNLQCIDQLVGGLRPPTTEVSMPLQENVPTLDIADGQRIESIVAKLKPTSRDMKNIGQEMSDEQIEAWATEVLLGIHPGAISAHVMARAFGVPVKQVNRVLYARLRRRKLVEMVQQPELRMPVWKATAKARTS